MDAQTIGTLRCTACGTLAPALCRCGAAYAYISPGELAAKAVKDNPEKSDRAIAQELGIGNKTVSRARPTVSDDTVDKRVGLDGKKRGRPKGSKTSKPKRAKPPGVKQAQRSIDLAPDVWEQVKARAAAANLPAAAFIGQLLTITLDPTIDPKTLSKTGQDKLAAAIRQAERKLRSEFEPLVAAEVIKRNKQTFPMLEKIEQEAKDAKRNYDQWFREAKKLGTVSEWNNLMFCLHPDTRRSASDQKFNTALAWVLSRKFAITGEK